jgi:TolA-binding protein
MKLERTSIVSCLLAFLLLAAVGCSKKATEDESASATKVETVDIAKPVSEVQAEAETMSSEDLKATALQYKEAILSKQDQIKNMSAKIKEIPIAEALGQEAQTLKTDLKDLGSNLTALKARFQVYYDTLKEKGGSLSGLEL